jgi:hypothetical protein
VIFEEILVAFQQSIAARNAQGDALIASVGNAGLLRIFVGTQPVDCATVSSGTKLSEHTLASPFAPATSSAVISPTLPANVNALATGTAGYYRVYKADGSTCVYQDAVVASGNGLVLNPSNDTLTSGQPVQINSWTVTIGGA